MPTTPFSLSCRQDNSSGPSTRVSATTDPVPLGKRFVVEHISGIFAVGEKELVDRIWAHDQANRQAIYLPTHFKSRPLNYGGKLGIAEGYQFGSPARMYIASGEKITIHGDSNVAGVIEATFIGHLE